MTFWCCIRSILAAQHGTGRRFGGADRRTRPTDADSLLDMLIKHREKLRPYVADDPCTRLLRLLTEDRRELVDQRTSHVQRLTDRLKTYFPQALEWAGGLTSMQAREFLDRRPTLEAIQSARPAAVRSFYGRHRHGGEWVDSKIAAIRSAGSLHSDEPITTAAAMPVRSEVAQIRALSTAIAAYDRRIAETFAEHEDAPIFASFPGPDYKWRRGSLLR